jgi:hypothetical protein
MSNYDICMLCPLATCAGKCLCTVDGAAIEVHAEKGDCPVGKYEYPEARVMPVKEKTEDCGCSRAKRKSS